MARGSFAYALTGALGELRLRGQFEVSRRPDYQPPQHLARQGIGRLLHRDERQATGVRHLHQQPVPTKEGDPAVVAGQALGELASIAREIIK